MSENNTLPKIETFNWQEMGCGSLELFHEFKGLDLNSALNKAYINGLLPQVAEFNGQCFSGTKEINSNRIHLRFQNNKCVDAYIC